MNEERIFYKTRLDAELHRKSGERMYREAGVGYYLHSPSKRKKTFLERLLEW